MKAHCVSITRRVASVNGPRLWLQPNERALCAIKVVPQAIKACPLNEGQALIIFIFKGVSAMKKNEIPYQMILPQSEIPKQWYNWLQIWNSFLPHISARLQWSPSHPMNSVHCSRRAYRDGVFKRALYWYPDDVREKYKLFRPTPLHRAYRLEKALGTPAHIYYKYEGTNPSGSHKLNSAVAQAYYNKIQGVKRIATETGAGHGELRLQLPAAFTGWIVRYIWCASVMTRTV